MKVMLINSLYLKFGLINGTTSIIHKIVIKTNNSTFTNPLLYVFVNFNTFITNHSILKNINHSGFPKNIIPIASIS